MENAPSSTPKHRAPETESSGTPLYDQLMREFAEQQATLEASTKTAETPPRESNKSPENAAVEQPTDNETNDKFDWAKVILESSDFLKQRIKALEKTEDKVLFVKEKSEKADDLKHAVKSKLYENSLHRLENKKRRLERRSDTTLSQFNKRRLGRKIRLLNMQIKNTSAFMKDNEAVRSEKIDRFDKDGNLFQIGTRSEQNTKRAEQLQRRIHRLIAQEYNFAMDGREYRKDLKVQLKGEGNPERREQLRKLLFDSRSLEAMEKIGRQVFINKSIKAGLKPAVIFAANQLDAAIKQGKQIG